MKLLNPGRFVVEKSLLLIAFCLCGVIAGHAQSQPAAVAVTHYFTNNPDGATPYTSLILGTDNSIYGCTSAGGTNDAGTVFKMNPDGSGYSVLYHFFPSENGAGFPLELGPFVLRGRDGVLYGGTQDGSTYKDGVLFKLNTDGSGYAILHNFTDNVPSSLLQIDDGSLCGAGLQGIFKIDTDGGNYSMLHAFNISVDGRFAYGQLIQGTDGFLYGTAEAGGSNSLGTVFKLDTGGTNFTVLHTFGATNDGAKPYGGLIPGDNGALYGATSAGGTNGAGTVYRLNPDGGGYQILHHFQTNSADGKNPFSQLTRGLNNLFYGTCVHGGATGNGTVYEIGTDGSGYQTVWSFPESGTNGVFPYGGLVRGLSSGDVGTLYGMNEAGGRGSWGAVYALVVNAPLTITPALTTEGSNPVVLWPAWAVGYQVQTTTNLTNGAWTTVSNGVPVTGIQLTNVPSGSYYRLIWNSTN